MGLSARSRALPRRTSASARMRGVRGRAAGPAHDPEGGRRHERPRVRCIRRDKNAAGFCEGKAAALQVSARGKIHRRTAEDRHRQDRPSGAVEDLAPPNDRTHFVIPGYATWRRPGIHTPCRGYGFRARSLRSRPGMTMRLPLTQPRPAIEPRQIAVVILRRLRAHDGVAEAGVFARGVVDVLTDGAG